MGNLWLMDKCLQLLIFLRFIHITNLVFMILGNNNVCLMNMSYGHTIMVYVIWVVLTEVIARGILVVVCRVLNYALRPYMTLSLCELPIAWSITNCYLGQYISLRGLKPACIYRKIFKAKNCLNRHLTNKIYSYRVIESHIFWSRY